MSAPSPFAVELREVTKSFGGFLANQRVSVQVSRGTVHAIVGENGAGKSTAMKILYGIYRPDSGSVWVKGVERRWTTAAEAIRAGVGMVHQHFMLAETCTALENIVLGCEPLRGPTWIPPAFRRVDFAKARERLGELAQKYGLHVPWDEKVGHLSVGLQQRLEILKLLYQDTDILILDEPTAVLTPQETQELFAQFEVLRSQGKTILLITHKLKEVMAVAQQVTVFRRGAVVANRNVPSTNAIELAELMIGRSVKSPKDRLSAPARSSGSPVLQFSNVTLESSGKKKLNEVSFEVQPGEVVGIAGVEGNGQSELLQILMDPRGHAERAQGEIKMMGRRLALFSEPSSCMNAAFVRKQALGFIPEDRHREALLLDQPIWSSFLLGLQSNRFFCEWGFLKIRSILKRFSEAVEADDIRLDRSQISRVLTKDLSGGNQQKVVIAREFFRQPMLLVAAQPTRGVDIGAIEMIHEKMLEAKAKGMGILLITSDLDEILALSDRILVFYDGQITAELDRSRASEKELGLKMGGVHASVAH